MFLLIIEVYCVEGVGFEAESSIEFLVVVKSSMKVTHQQHPNSDVELATFY